MACFEPGSDDPIADESIDPNDESEAGQTNPDPIVEAAARELLVELAPGVVADRFEFWADHEFVARAWSSTGEEVASTILAALDLPHPGTPTWQLDGDQSIWDLDVAGSEVVVLGESGLSSVVRWPAILRPASST